MVVRLNRTIESQPALTTMILPPYVPASEEEFQRRRELYESAKAFRERIGPLGFDPAELVREVRDEADED